MLLEVCGISISLTLTELDEVERSPMKEFTISSSIFRIIPDSAAEARDFTTRTSSYKRE
jgi:hypothetical protein